MNVNAIAFKIAENCYSEESNTTDIFFDQIFMSFRFGSFIIIFAPLLKITTRSIPKKSA